MLYRIVPTADSNPRDVCVQLDVCVQPRSHLILPLGVHIYINMVARWMFPTRGRRLLRRPAPKNVYAVEIQKKKQ